MDDLEVYERKFLSCLQDVETVQKQSNQVNVAYMKTEEELDKIGNAQSGMVRELEEMERQLNTYFSQQVRPENRDLLDGAQDDSNEVFDQASGLKASVEALEQRTNQVNQLMEVREPKSESPSMADFFQSLQWIENTAIDMKFQVDQIDR